MRDPLRQATPSAGALAADGLGIFEDDLPTVPFYRSAFRLTEYVAYLRHFPHALLYSTHMKAHGRDEDFTTHFARAYPDLAPRVRAADQDCPVRRQLAYTVFLNNVWSFLSYFERHRIPFCFTLYPGGGLRVHDPATDRRLRRVFASPCFHKVLVTQNLTDRYLRENRLCRADRIEFLYGGLFPLEELARACPPKKRYPHDKPCFDVCFVAYKYSPRGEEKGFDVFLDCARRLLSQTDDLRFHVVGNFTEADAPAGLPRDRLFFHGPQPTAFFPAFHSAMDVIIAPNKPSVLAPGAFDGFPTGCCIEAAACGVAVLCTDPLGMNIALKDREDVLIIPPDAATIATTVLDLYRSPDMLYRLAEQGRRTCLRVFGPDAQLRPRLQLIRRCLKPSAAVGWRGLVKAGMRHLLRRTAPGAGRELALTPQESNSLHLQAAAMGGLRQGDLPYELLSIHQAVVFSLHAPPPHLDVATTVCLNLEFEGPIRSVLLHAAPLPRADLGPLPLQLTIAAHGGREGEGELLAERTETLVPEAPRQSLALDLAVPRVVRSLRLLLRMAPGAAHNWYGRVTVTDVSLVAA